MRRFPRVLLRPAAIALGLSTVAACGSNGGASIDANEAATCTSTGRGDVYTAGLEKMGSGGKLDFKLVSATPAPPARSLNAWVLQVNSMAAGAVGTPAANAQLVVTPWMPDHQHGAGAYKVKVAPMANGQYQLTDINTWMPGYWEITIDATVGAVHDTALYKFCIQP